MRNNSRQFRSYVTNGYRIQKSRWTMLAVALLITLSFVCGAGAATITVTTPNQGIADDGLCSLQEAIYSANLDSSVAPSSFNPLVTFNTGCAPGSGADVIELQPGAVYPMTAILDDPYNPIGPTANPIILSNITINGNGATLLRANPNRDFAGVNFRAFAITYRSFADPDNDLHVAGDGEGNLTIRDLYIKGFTAKGGNGAGGGGGGLGAGGAIYVTSATVTIENSTFQDNGAGGGNGAPVNDLGNAGGGGGGLGGNAGDLPNRADFNGGSGGGGARSRGSAPPSDSGWGGDGGGTMLDAANDTPGYRCGGEGAEGVFGFGLQDGEPGACRGGGGGGGSGDSFYAGGNGGDGDYGGGGGGGAGSGTNGYGDGGHGGFGGGGGATGRVTNAITGPDGGGGGFGGGGGAGGEDPGAGGSFAGNGSHYAGGGGAGLGGAIFSDNGTVTIYNSTFTGNFVVRGLAGGTGAQNGRDEGGAIFSVDGLLTVLNATLSGNESTGEGGGIVLYGSTRDFSGSLTIHNTIIANNGVRECFYTGDLGQITAVGSGNLIVQNFGCPGMVLQGDPQLGLLQLNAPGMTPTMAIKSSSPAFNAGDNVTCLIFDQRGVARPQCGYCDIGAYEVSCVPQIQLPGDVSLPDTCVGSTSTTTLNVCNTGKEDLEVGQITSSNAEFAVTTPSSQYPVVVSPDFCFPFQVRFTPTSAGAKTSTLTIPSNDTANPSATLQATGKGTVGDIRVTGSNNFGNVCAETLAEKTISVCNVGGCTLGVTGASFDPACPDFTAINNPFPAPVSPDSCLDLTIRFTPTSAGSKSCSLVITSDDPDTPSVTRTVTANTPAASIDVSPDFAFSPTVIQSIGACSSRKSFPISNTGTCNLNITNIAIGGDNGSDFSFSGLPSFPVILEPGHVVGDGALKTVFKPTALDRDRMGTLAVTYVSDPVTNGTTSVTRQMCGEGVNTGARVLVTGGGVPLSKVEKIQLQRITGNRNKKILDTKDVVMNVSLTTVTPSAPCTPFQYHREYGTVSNPIQLLPGSYQVTVTAIVNGKRVSKTVGFSVDTCGFNPTIVINF